MASIVLQVRVDEKLKNETEEILNKIGLNMSNAVRLFLNRVKIEKGLPFPMHIIEKETKEEEPTFDPVEFMNRYIKEKEER